MNTPLPLDGVAMAAFYANRRNLEPKIADAVYDQALAALTLAARVAELEAELAESDRTRDMLASICKRTAIALKGPEPDMGLHNWSDLPEVATVAIAHANALRDALEKADAAFNAWGRDEDGIHPDAWPAVEHLRETLKAHPAASLAAYRAEVIEQCASAAESYLWNLPAIQSQVGANCGDAIRALAAQAQEVTK